MFRMTARSEFEDQKSSEDMKCHLIEVKLALCRVGDVHGFPRGPRYSFGSLSFSSATRLSKNRSERKQWKLI